MLKSCTALCFAFVGLMAGCDETPMRPTAAVAQEVQPAKGQLVPTVGTEAPARPAASEVAATCASPDALAAATEALWMAIGKQAADDAERSKLAQAKSGFVVAFENVRLVHRDASSGRERCAAELVVGLTDAAKQTAPKEFKQSASSDVDLTSQTTADGKRLVVELSGQDQPAEFVRSLTSMGALDGAVGKP
jgi:hypothetical protein